MSYEECGVAGTNTDFVRFMEVPLRVLNLTEKTVVVYKGASAGLFQVIYAVGPHVTSEDDCSYSSDGKNVNQIKTRERKAETPANHELPESLQEMLQRGSTQLNSDETVQLSQLIRENQCLLSLSKDDIGLTSLTEYSINTGDASPIRQAIANIPEGSS